MKPQDKPAFPLQVLDKEGEVLAPFLGLSKREYFAGEALKAIRQSRPCDPSVKIAEVALSDADALIEELKRTEH